MSDQLTQSLEPVLKPPPNSPFFLDADGVYRCYEFQQFVWQQHGFGTRQTSPRVDITCKQIHSDVVINAHGIADRACEGDALITNEAGQSIGVRTADCVPMLILDRRTRALAAVHAGWRGSAQAIVLRTLEHLHAAFGTETPDVLVAIGPCIRACCYEVGPEVLSRFELLFPERPLINGKGMLDLAEANRRLLQSAGLSSNQILDSRLCTMCNAAHFFSYRREPENPGRLLSAIQRLA